ncbi:MAG TPA: hypothetical protein PLZ08_00630 [Bacillota bacterium]|nr:hypothetical protein [Bacillota bacterium]HOL08997.1 hypothetical protein [Bacillota bacterium]HPO96449.1 hypothetical protein [Bacillota bacterium]
MHKVVSNVFLILCLLVMVSVSLAEQSDIAVSFEVRPIVVIVADKLDSMELFNSQLPGVRRLLSESACGLMVIRSASGYTNSGSGFLTLGSGERSGAPNRFNGAYSVNQKIGANNAADYLKWINGSDLELEDHNIVIPEIGAAKLLAEQNQRKVVPGLLGSLFNANGWETVLIGNSDNSYNTNRLGGWLLMNGNGIVSTGSIGKSINEINTQFPYLIHFDNEQSFEKIKQFIASRRLVVVDFGDFFRLNGFREEVLPAQFGLLKQQVWKRFDQLINAILDTWSRDEIDLIIISPSLSNESWRAKRWLTPFIIRSQNYDPGILKSRTTKWDGLVTNIDFLPTISDLAGINSDLNFPGRKVELTVDQVENKLNYLTALNQRLNSVLNIQRTVIDGYLGIIISFWVLFILGLVLRKNSLVNKLLLILLSAPLALICQPILPQFIWGIGSFVLLSVLIAGTTYLLFKKEKRLLILMGLTWLVLVIDQVSGWRLIRYSALGYSPAAGSRFYGIGNEFMGIFLAVSLILAHLLNKERKLFWITPVILISSTLILGSPNWGTNFGGILAAVIGFSFYLIKLYEWKLNYRKVLLGLLIGAIVILLFGWWDLSRPVAEQTHVGRFFGLLVKGEFADIGLVLTRKLGMNLRLFMVSSWTKIVLLALGIIILLYKFFRKRMPLEVDDVIWQGILASGIAAAVFNDSGVVALGTCLAVGFTFRLYQLNLSNYSPNNKSLI